MSVGHDQPISHDDAAPGSAHSDDGRRGRGDNLGHRVRELDQ